MYKLIIEYHREAGVARGQAVYYIILEQLAIPYERKETFWREVVVN